MRDKAPVVSDKPLTPAEVLQVSTHCFFGPVQSTETSLGFDVIQGFLIQLVLPGFDLSHMTC